MKTGEDHASASGGYRYFRDDDGTRWKMPVNGKPGFIIEKGETDWRESYTQLHEITQPFVMEVDGTVETDEHGTPLAPQICTKKMGEVVIASDGERSAIGINEKTATDSVREMQQLATPIVPPQAKKGAHDET